MELIVCDSEHLLFAGRVGGVYQVPLYKDMIINGKMLYYELSETIHKDELVICKYLVQVDEV